MVRNNPPDHNEASAVSAKADELASPLDKGGPKEGSSNPPNLPQPLLGKEGGKEQGHPSEGGTSAVVITGMGLVTCLGLDRASTWQAVQRGRSGIAPLTAIESPLKINKGGGEAPPLPDADRTCYPREVAYLRLALQEALRHASIGSSLPYPAHRCGVVLGTTLHGIRSGGRYLRTNEMDALRSFLAANTLQQAVEGFGMTGFRTTVCSACSSGLAAIALGVTLLQTGQLDLVVAGGYDPISEYAYGGFNSMRLITSGSLRPFSRDRDGMKIGEGYGTLVLERAADAVARGVEPAAIIGGFGESCDAFHLSKPHPEGAGAARAIAGALAMAGLSSAEVGMVAAHSTATLDNDAAEYTALRQVLEADLAKTPVVAFKSLLAHTLGGAGAVELILSASALGDGVIPPVANVSADQVAFEDLRLVTGEAQRVDLSTTLNTSLGFGGSNMCVVLRRARTGAAPHGTAPRARAGRRKVWITGVGVVVPSAIGNEAFVCLLKENRSKPHDLSNVGDEAMNLDHLLNARRVRRMSNYVKLTLAAATLAYQDAQIADAPAFGESCYGVLGTTHGSTVFSERYYRQIVEEGIDAANPLLFAEGVPNAGAAHLSMMLSIKGLCQSVIGTRTAGLDALLLATQRIASGGWDRAVVSAADEFAPLINSAYQHFGLRRTDDGMSSHRRRSGFVTGWGAVTLILESERSAEQRGVQPRGFVEACAGASGSPRQPRGMIDAARQVLAELDRPRYIIASANQTWTDRVELRAIESLARGNGADADVDGPVVSAIFGHIPEAFSVNPLAGLAGVLLSGRLPSWRLAGPRGVCVATGEERPERFAAICTDYSGTVTGVRVGLPR